jgi:hypothetical protein
LQVFIAFTLGLLVFAAPLQAEESIDEEPIPASVVEIVAPMDRLGKTKLWRPGLFPELKEKLKDYPPFLRDTKLTLSLRSYYQLRSNYEYSGSINEAWAAGGALSYTSGWLYDRVSIGASLYTNQPVYAPEDRDGAGDLAPGQRGVTVLGQLYGRVRLDDETFINLYRYSEFNSPFMNQDYGKMMPYTFEGYTIQGGLGGKEGGPRLVYGGGYITKIKDKTSDDFIWMSEKVGATAKRGVTTLGGRYSHGGFSLGAIDYYSDDIINIGYAETTYTMTLPNDLGVRFAAQFTDQRSTGRDLLYGTSFSTTQVGFKSDVSYRGGIISLAYTANSTGYNLQNPWSGYPGYTSSMISDYKNAGTDAITTKVSYDFSRLGLEGVTAYLLFTHGWGMVDQTTKAPLPNENEFDADLQWRPNMSWLSGLSIRGRYGVLHQYEGPKQYIHDSRIYLKYDFQLM